MSHPRGGVASRIQGIASATAIAMLLGIVSPAFAADGAMFSGAVIGADNLFAENFTVVFKDVATGHEYRSAPSNSLGQYQVQVPVGGRYKLDSVLAPDGTKLAVQNIPPIRVMTAGSNQVDVKFSNASVSAAASPSAVEPTAGSGTVPRSAGAPWWKRPGPITGIVIGAVAAAALIVVALDDDDASPSNP